jgi:hypothetical protein
MFRDADLPLSPKYASYADPKGGGTLTMPNVRMEESAWEEKKGPAHVRRAHGMPLPNIGELLGLYLGNCSAPQG